MKKKLLSLMCVALLATVAVKAQAEDTLSPGAYFRIPGTAIEFTYPLADTSIVSLYDFWQGEGLVGGETKLATGYNFNVNFGAVTSFEANGMPFFSLEYNFGTLISNFPKELAKAGLWAGWDFRGEAFRAGIKASVALW